MDISAITDQLKYIKYHIKQRTITHYVENAQNVFE